MCVGEGRSYNGLARIINVSGRGEQVAINTSK